MIELTKLQNDFLEDINPIKIITGKKNVGKVKGLKKILKNILCEKLY